MIYPAGQLDPLRRVALCCVFVASLFATGGPGQKPAPTFEVRLALADDPENSGPPAWVSARADWLPAPKPTPGTFQLRHDGTRWIHLDPHPDSTNSPFAGRPEPLGTGHAGATYMVATAVYAGWRIRATCDRDGRERWQVRRASPGTDLSGSNPTLATALAALGLTDDNQPIVIDTAAWIGQFIDSCEGNDTATQLLLLAGECGPTTIVLRPTDAAGTWTAIGRSHGGLLLPALLTVLADGSRPESPTTLDWQQRHQLRATTRLDSGAAEATRQLAGQALRAPEEPIWQAALECQLFATDERQSIAAAGLLRSKATTGWRTLATFAIAQNENPTGHALTKLARHRLANPVDGQGDPMPSTALSHPGEEEADEAIGHDIARRRTGLLGGSILALLLVAALWIRSHTA